jgi:NTE family protein
MNALVLSGGGSRGSWQAGALKYIGEKTKYMGSSCPYSSGFPFVSGTSVGSINAAGIAMFPPSEFFEATQHVVTLWNQIHKTSDIWCLRKPMGAPALWNPSLGTNEALVKFLTDVVDIPAIVKSGITLRLPAVNLETGSLYEYGIEDLKKFGINPILASASFPIAFPPVCVATGWMTDGGIIDMAPLGCAIDAGANRILVLVTRNPNGVEPKPRCEMKNAFQVASRVLDIVTQTILENDLKICESTNEKIRKGQAPDKKEIQIDLIGPSQPLGDSLDFSEALMKVQMTQGYADARAYFEKKGI